MAKSNDKKHDAAESAQDLEPVAGQSFKVGKKAFKYIFPKINIPGIGIRTALEACTDDVAHSKLGGKTINEFLVEIGSGAVAEV